MEQVKIQNKRMSMRVKKIDLDSENLKELDSDEERCDLVDEKNGLDRHFFC